tara:strand:+ start:3765 stop:4382 length:618 start_codon:yes stop_codon:yes gene_type:complete
MKGNWYTKCLPTIKNLSSSVNNILQEIKKADEVKNVYLWGSYAKNIKNSSFRVKDVDVLAQTSINSEDLVSIDKLIISEKKTSEELQDEGFDPAAVAFSKKIASLDFPLLDMWVISGDNKLVHWGAIEQGRKESDEIKKEAETFAENQTGLSVKKVSLATESRRTNWYSNFHNHYSKQLSGMPSGWYISDEKDIKSILKNEVIKK